MFSPRLSSLCLVGLSLQVGCAAELTSTSSPAERACFGADRSADHDGDGLSNARELILRTDPCDRDSDHDGQTDAIELLYGGDPLDAAVLAPVKVLAFFGSDGAAASVNFELDVRQVDISFLMDTTASMGALVGQIATDYSAIVEALSVDFPDISYGIATFEDYAWQGLGSVGQGDRPFSLHQQQTTSMPLVQRSLDLELHYGGDEPESLLEALYQALAGRGYDQDCDGVYDHQTDVLPFETSDSDAFFGMELGAGEPDTPGGGPLGGMGFRRGALPIIIYASDAEMRDPQGGYEAPPGCPRVAGSDDVVSALQKRGGRLVGISTLNAGITSLDQMRSLARRTGSMADWDRDGVKEPMVLQWSGESEIQETIVYAVRELMVGLRFPEVRLKASGPGAAYLGTSLPDVYYNVSGASAEPLDFHLRFWGMQESTRAHDQLVPLTLSLEGDGEVSLGQEEWVLLFRANAAK